MLETHDNSHSELARLIPPTGDHASDVLSGVLLIYSLVSPIMTPQIVLNRHVV